MVENVKKKHFSLYTEQHLTDFLSHSPYFASQQVILNLGLHEKHNCLVKFCHIFNMCPAAPADS